VARHLAETVECDEAKKLVKRELEKLAQAGEPPNRILRCLADDDVYRALFHVKLCLCRSCRETLADCGDWK
jgi:hypothetical protein